MTSLTKEADFKVDSMEDRYERAQSLMQGIFNNTLAFNATLYPNWIGESDHFWYERESRKGKEYRLVDAGTATNICAFDHAILAAALAEGAEQEVDPDNLPISKVYMVLAPTDSSLTLIRFTAFGKRWAFETQTGTCQVVDIFPEENAGPDGEVVSPDGQYTAFMRDHNLWLRDLNSGDERALTQNGEENYVYGAPGSAWGRSHETALQVRWSPNSKQIFTVQRDTRRVKSLPVMHHVPLDGSLRPTISHIKIAYPGDNHIEELRLLAIDISTARIQPANYCQIPVTRNGYGFFTSNFGWWGKDSHHAYFVHVERDYKVMRLVEFNTSTGTTKILFEETTNTHINLMLNNDAYPTFMPLPETNELIWFSERSGWAHLYLYDLASGALKNAITQKESSSKSGEEWLVQDIAYFDAKRREVFIHTSGRTVGRDPYYRDLVRVHIDTGELTTISSSDHDNVTYAQGSFSWVFANALGRDMGFSGVSNSGNFAVVTRSRADTTPVNLLVDRDGNEILKLEVADISALPDGWQWPEPVKLLAADGATDIYGLVFRPADFSPDKSYPVVSHMFNTPELPCVSKGSFSNGACLGWSYLDAAALSQLGFIVVQIDGRGTPYRGKTFHDESYGWAESASNLDDHVAGIKQLAEQYPYMDLARVGVTTHQAGGPGAVQGLLKHPEFFKVGVSGWLHDSRLISASMWGDKYEGLSGPDKSCQYPEELVQNLQGKLLIMHGMLDTSTPPAGTFRFIEALQKANKDFDMLFLPNMIHALPSYLIRRSWDYFVEHLQGSEPPKEFKLKSSQDNVL